MTPGPSTSTPPRVSRERRAPRVETPPGRTASSSRRRTLLVVHVAASAAWLGLTPGDWPATTGSR
ncbi:hypothetical protein ACFVZA_05365 [Streptomyces bottropensis]|uniref:hypothetical protein n=1 Tax=Streptomyces bottropensis TaxID=42235 RepID=UPI003698A20C